MQASVNLLKIVELGLIIKVYPWALDPHANFVSIISAFARFLVP